MHPRRSREEGQVTPALLIAVIGGFALAVAFVSLQNLLDQTGRATTASDAAALAAADAHADAASALFAGNSGLHLGQLEQLLGGSGSHALFVDAAQQAAQEYAGANGATLAAPVAVPTFDPAALTWTYEVRTRQEDVVEGGTSKVRTASVSRAEVSFPGLCRSGTGFGLIVGGAGCLDLGALDDLCELALNPPSEPPSPTSTPTTGPSGSPSASPTAVPSPTPSITLPPGFDAPSCVSVGDVLSERDVRLVQ